jgi:hypothetical protein
VIEVTIIGIALLGIAILVWRTEGRRVEHIRETLASARDLGDALSWYPREMHEEITRIWYEDHDAQDRDY